MGNSEISLKTKDHKPILISHQQFQNAGVIKNSQGKQIVEVGKSMKSQRDFLLWQKNFKRIPKINALLYPEEVKYINGGCCGSSGIALIQYPLYRYVLAEQISQRKSKTRGHFYEGELWLLLHSLVSCAQIFHVRKLKIGDVRPQNIFLNEEGHIKVASQFTFPYGTSNYQKTLVNRQLVTYLAPEQVRNLTVGKMKDSSDPALVEVFTIGLTLLDAALLHSSDNFYEPNGAFSMNKLNQCLKQLKSSSYSPRLVGFICRMCELIPANRIKISEIIKYLKPYENQILQRKPFDKNYEQNPESSTDLSRISFNKNDRASKQSDYKFVNGMVFMQLENSLSFQSLTQSKQLKPTYSNIPTTHQLKEKDRVSTLHSPVRTTIKTPPIVIDPPHPSSENVRNQNNNSSAF